jgi:purine-binding chemotaxis protein CheW
MPTSTPDGDAAVPGDGARDHVLLFTIEGREFAVRVDAVIEIVRHRAPTRVPGTAPAVEGIIPVRGQMVTLLDLRRCLALPPRPSGAAAQVIVVRSADDRLGLVVDGVSGVAPRSNQVAPLDIAALLRGMS